METIVSGDGWNLTWKEQKYVLSIDGMDVAVPQSLAKTIVFGVELEAI